MRVVVIGAGGAGLCALRHLVDKPAVFETMCFEKANTIGGTWVYTDQVGSDQHGVPIYSSMYKNLRTILPKEIMAFPDLPFPPSLPSYVHHADVLQYLKHYTDKFDLEKYIKFRTMVENITPVVAETGVKWDVTVRYLDDIDGKVTHIRADAVMVCTGSHWAPSIPQLPGISQFTGRVLHSQHYRNPEEMRGCKVFVVGAGSSGIDITMEIAEHASEVYWSHLKIRFTFPLPNNVHQVGGLSCIKSDSIMLDDGGEVYVDTILMCTGYAFSFPFLSPECGVQVDKERVTPLYKHLIHTQYPTLCLVGVCKSFVIFPHFDNQIRFFLATLDGSVTLPSTEEMNMDENADYERRLESGMPHRYAHYMDAERLRKYHTDVSEMACIPRLQPVLFRILEYVLNRIAEDFMNHRNDSIIIIDDETFVIKEA